MASNTLTAKIGLDTSDMQQNVSEAKKKLQEIIDSLNSTTAEFRNMGGGADDAASKIQLISESFEKLKNWSIESGQGVLLLQEGIEQLNQVMTSVPADSNVANSLNEIIETTKKFEESVNPVQHFTDTITQSANSTKSIKKEYFELERELTKLTAQWRAMTDAQRASARGQEIQAKMDEIKEKASSLKDTLGDVKSEIKALADDHSNLTAFNDVIGVSGNLVSTLSSTVAVATGNEKQFRQAVAAFTAVQALSNTLTKMSTVLNKSNIVMLKVHKIQTLASAAAIRMQTRAQQGNIVQTKLATAAQRVFNAVANANPYVLLATAILGVTAAMVGLTSAFGDSDEGAENMKSDVDELNKELRKLKSESQGTIMQFNAIKQVWDNSNKTAEDAVRIYKQYGQQLKDMGMDIKDANDAVKKLNDDSFNALKENIMKKFKLKQLEAKLNAEMTKLNVIEEHRIEMKERARLAKEKQNAMAKILNKMGLPGTKMTMSIMDSIALSGDWDKMAKQATGNVEKNIDSLIRQIGGLQGELYTEIEGNDKKLSASSAKRMTKEQWTINKVYQDYIDSIKSELKKEQDTIDAIYKKYGGNLSKLPFGTMDMVDLQHAITNVKSLQNEMSKVQKNFDDFSNTISKADDSSNVEHFYELTNDKIVEEMKEMFTMFDQAAIIAEKAQKGEAPEIFYSLYREFVYAVHGYLGGLQNMGMWYPQRLNDILKSFTEFDTGKNISVWKFHLKSFFSELYDSFEQEAERERKIKARVDFEAQVDESDSKRKFIFDEDGMLHELESYDQYIERRKKQNEQQKQADEDERQIYYNRAQNAEKAFGTFGDMFNSMAEAMGDGSDKTVKAMGQLSAAIGPLVKNIMMLLVPQAIMRAEEAQPWWMVPIQIMANVAAVASALQNFAQGGIVQNGGNYDRVHVMAHPGEMILNSTQQAKLWKMLDTPIVMENQNQNRKVQFVIKGQNLIGVEKNYGAKKSFIK